MLATTARLQCAPCTVAINKKSADLEGVELEQSHARTASLQRKSTWALAQGPFPVGPCATEQRSQAAAQYQQVTVEGYKLQRKDFRFGNFNGWLKRGGEWQIEGAVQHRGLMCGTYEVGMRFGIGNPGCTDVQWISGDEFVTSKSQCNEAEMQHTGYGIAPGLAEQFDAVTCAERVIRCTGNCK